MGDVALDIHKLLKKVDQQLEQMKSTTALDEFLIIDRVREQTRNIRPDDYTPHYVPIGPYHWSQRRIDDKSKYLYICLAIASKKNTVREKEVVRQREVVLDELLRGMKELETDPRRCYSDRFDSMGAENYFLQRLLLDGCYLLVCFARLKQETTTQQQDGQQATTKSASGLVAPGNNDAKVRETWYLLENQIPFFVVQRIYELVTGGTQSAVLTMFADYIKKQLKEKLYISATARPPTSDLQNPSHLLHLVHTCFTWTENSRDQAEGGNAASSETGRWHRATEYCSYANVGFYPRKLDNGEASSVLDVSLEGGALRVPVLRVDNDTWTILRNLMALEEHHAVSLKRHVTAYCLFMSQLACTKEDVELLVRSRVVEHFHGSNAEVAAGFADLCKGVVLNVDDPSSNYLKPVWHKLERRYRSPWHNLVGFFLQTHGRNPWYVAVFVATVILFAVQMLQFIFKIIEYKTKK